MKIHIKIVKRIALIAMMALCMLFVPMSVSAEVQEADFINHDGGDLAFSFFYEADVPDLVFISPSGVEYAEGVASEAELVIGRGEGWSTYRIPDAEVGQWRLRYDKKNNATIEYVEVKPVEAIAIQSFTLAGVENDVVNATFNVRKGDEDVRYYYTVDLVDGNGTVVKEEVARGWAETKVEQTVSVRLNVSTGSDYRLSLNVSHDDGEETFDSRMTETFAYTNPNTPAAIADFTVQMDSERSRCTVDWSDYRPGRYGYVYSITAIADGDRENPIYVSDAEEETSVSFFYPTDATTMEIEISYVQNGITSEAKGKTIDLTSGEYLKITAEDVVGDALLPLEYFVKTQTELRVTVNGVEGAYLVDGEGVLSLSLQTGSNTVEASFVGEDNLVYSVSKEVFYTWVSPTILLYEDLNGMTFKAGNIPISGKVEGAASVSVNGAEVELAEDGSFLCEVPIVAGENTITVEAVSATGVSSARTITVIGEGKGASDLQEGTGGESDGDKAGADGSSNEDEADAQSGVKALIEKWTSAKWFPTAIAAAVSVLVLIFFFLTLRNKKKKKFVARLRNALIGFCLLELALGVTYFLLCRFNNSLEYVALAQTSVQKAALYLNCEIYGKYVLLGVGGVIVLLALILLIVSGIKKLKNRKKEQVAVPVEESTEEPNTEN